MVLCQSFGMIVVWFGASIQVITSINPCTSCPPGEGVGTQCKSASSFVDTVCVPCVSGLTFSSDNSAVDKCSKCSSCNIGYFPLKPCTVYHDVVCVPCLSAYQQYDLKEEHSKYCGQDPEYNVYISGAASVREQSEAGDSRNNLTQRGSRGTKDGESLASQEESSEESGEGNPTFTIIIASMGSFLVVICVAVIVHNKRKTIVRRCNKRARSRQGHSYTNTKHVELKRLNNHGHKSRQTSVPRRELIIPTIVITDLDGPVRPPSWMEEEAGLSKSESSTTEDAIVENGEDSARIVWDGSSVSVCDNASFTNEEESDDILNEAVTRLSQCNIYRTDDMTNEEETKSLLDEKVQIE